MIGSASRRSAPFKASLQGAGEICAVIHQDGPIGARKRRQIYDIAFLRRRAAYRAKPGKVVYLVANIQIDIL